MNVQGTTGAWPFLSNVRFLERVILELELVETLSGCILVPRVRLPITLPPSSLRRCVLRPNKTLHSYLLLSTFLPDAGMNGTNLTGFLGRINEMMVGKYFVQHTGHDKLSIISNVDGNYSTVCNVTRHGACENITRTIAFMQFRSYFYFYNP